MTNFATLTWQAATAGRWTARILGTLMVLLVLTIAIGEGLPQIAQMTAREQLYAVGMCALFLGLVVAWFHAGWGGLLTLAGWAFLAVLARKFPGAWAFAVPAAIGLLHILCWWRLRTPAPPAATLDPAIASGVRMVLIVLGMSLGAFVLLCVNEIFGQPPLMVRTGPPPSDLVGSWTATIATVTRKPLPNEISAQFMIASDGSVTGELGGATLVAARLEANRSWFGRLMHLRTDYLIRGSLSRPVESYGGISGDRFNAPLQPRGSELDGALFLSHPSAPKPLGLTLKKR